MPCIPKGCGGSKAKAANRLITNLTDHSGTNLKRMMFVYKP